jgi:imidazolonepropionase-like amidohydrolase
MAGAFLAPPGGYPSDRDWAPTGSVECIATAEDIPDAVERQITAGADHIKVTLNAQAGPVFDEVLLSLIVAAAHDRGRKVVAHAEGSGQAAKAFGAGVDVLAHAPWTERLDERLLQAMAGSMSWISTLDIHGWGNYGRDFEIAQENIRRFHAAGGRVSYGTDMGNGATITGINTRELQALQDAGFGPGELLAAMLPNDAAAPAGPRLSWHPSADVPGPEEMAAWLAGVTVVHATKIKEKFS